MNFKNLYGAIANKMMVLIAIVAISMSSNIALANNNQQEEYDEVVSAVEDTESHGTTTMEYDEMDEYPMTDLCEIEGHKYDNEGNPLSGWVIGLMKTITQDEKKDLWNLASDTTDNDGYYCLTWDGETRELREGSQSVTDGEFILIYSVYEEMKDGWTYHSIEKGVDTSNLEVVPESEITVEPDLVSTQIGETNGYIYADAAYHVDFYNKLIKEGDEVSDGGSGGDDSDGSEDDNDGGSGDDSDGGGDGGGSDVSEEESSGSTGTRVGDRKRSGSSTRTNPDTEPQPTPQVLGEQVSVIPVGGVAAGHGGSNQGLTFEQKLFISERLQLLK